MPVHRPNLLPAPEPTRVFFDPFNSSSTGHQRAENRLSGSTSWRESRAYKLSHQLRDSSGRGGGQHLSDLVGAGSERFGKDGRKDNGSWEPGAPGLREKGWQDIRGLMGGNRKRSVEEKDETMQQKRRRMSSELLMEHEIRQSREANVTTTKEVASGNKSSSSSSSTAEHTCLGSGSEAIPVPSQPQIFRNLNIYLNGSTGPLISDHKLKQLFSRHGGDTSIALGRRTATHVVIGNDYSGGGLSSGKIQKEVALVGGKGVKYVTAQWVLDSIEKGIRQPEARYVPKSLDGRIGGSGQGSVRNMFVKKTTK
ncbi:hypothetical protein LTR46_002740 [Exophiala xenobiotica]|nr:hypothetical protein LTR46_002740 [Exophiala xenobiotica]